MKRVKIAELKNHLSEHLRGVEAGEEIVVTDRDRPIARIIPFKTGQRSVKISKPTRSFASLRNKRFPPARWKVSSTDLLLEERQNR
ncbi:MAG: type II toxin-antitoxin system prevent-host-death family antitoxin [Actinobacteria bacterium]|nr:type II toxin-antitoxin system prevent-host-death family antitoxin [Actinomycetota bacterium]